MSYDISLTHPVTKEVLHLDAPHQMKGGTFAIGGTTQAELNVTYNYSQILYSVIDGGLRGLYGKTGAETLPILKGAANKLKDDVDSDYWKATEGNVKAAMLQLISLAELRPDGVWMGD